MLSDDVSSIDTLSNHSFEDDDLEHIVASHSPESSAFDDTGFNERHVVIILLFSLYTYI